MSEKYQRQDCIRVFKTVCIEFGNNDDTWIWCYLDVWEALTKAKELLMKLEPDERLVTGTAYCGQNLRTGEILELVPSEAGLKGLLSISSEMCDGKRRGRWLRPSRLQFR